MSSHQSLLWNEYHTVTDNFTHQVHSGALLAHQALGTVAKTALVLDCNRHMSIFSSAALHAPSTSECTSILTEAEGASGS